MRREKFLEKGASYRGTVKTKITGIAILCKKLKRVTGSD
jgi:hypothetical protein